MGWDGWGDTAELFAGKGIRQSHEKLCIQTKHKAASNKFSVFGKVTRASEFPKISGVKAKVTSRLFQICYVTGTSLINPSL